MKLNAQEQASILELMNRIYGDIAELESKFGLMVGGGDMRPRIDYFHDAIRALTSGTNTNRLKIEMLSYDVQCVRYIQQMPLAPFKPAGDKQSPMKDIMTAGAGLVSQTARPDRAAKERIVELYQHYGVMFAALLKPSADTDYNDRTDTLNADVRDIHSVVSELEGKTNENTLATLAQQIEDPEMRMLLTKFLQHGMHKKTNDVKKLLAHLKLQVKAKDKAIKAVDNAHMEFATAQLGLYEESKEMLKKLAVQGMNLVGKFVAASVQQARQQRGR